MNYTLRNIVGTVLILFILIFGYYFLFSRQKGQYIPAGWEDFDCMYPTIISSDSLQPILMKGSVLILNQCINDSTNIEKGDIVIFNQDDIKRIGIVEDITIKDRENTYTVFTDSINTQKFDITLDNIYAYTVIPTAN